MRQGGDTGVKWSFGSHDNLHFSKETDLLISGYPEQSLVVIHNHPGQYNFSLNDLKFFFNNKSVKILTIVTNYGGVKYISKNENFDRELSLDILGNYKDRII